MTSATRSHRLDPVRPRPVGLRLAPWSDAAFAALPGLGRRITAQVLHEIPEYAEDPTGAIAANTQRIVQEALAMFVTTLAGGSALQAEQAGVFRRLGRTEAAAGRSHDTLQSAYRIASQAIMHQMLDWERQFDLPRETIAQLSSAIFAFIADLATLSAEGFAAAQVDQADAGRQRARLISLLAQPGNPSRKILAQGAARVGWALPEQCSFVEVSAATTMADDELVALAVTIFGAAALAAVVDGRSSVIVSDPVDPAVVRTALLGRGISVRLFVGPRGPLLETAISARLARRAASRYDARAQAEGGVLMCDDHLLELFADSSRDVARALVRRRLGPLLGTTVAKRLKYGRLLSAWLEYGTTHGAAPGVLDKPRGTLNYQLSQLVDMFGPALRDRSARLEIMLALRSVLPEWEREEAAGQRPRPRRIETKFIPGAPNSVPTSARTTKKNQDS